MDDDRYQALRGSGRLLAMAAPLARWTVMIASGLWFLNRAGFVFSDAMLTPAERFVAGLMAVAAILLGLLGSWIIERILRTGADVIDAIIDQTEAADQTAELIEGRLVPCLERIQGILERWEARDSGVAPLQPSAIHAGSSDQSNPRFDPQEALPTSTPEQARPLAISVIRGAIADHRWSEADRLIATFRENHPSAPEVANQLETEFHNQKRELIVSLRDELTEARNTDQPDRALSLRDELTLYLRGETLLKLDRRLIRWLDEVIARRRLDQAKEAEVDRLLQRIAETFGDDPEAQQLLARHGR